MKAAEQLDARWHRNFNATQRRLWLKERAVAHLGGSCRLCGYDRCVAALEFHHPGQKDFEISRKASWDTIRPELDRCVLLCSTCHREVHAGLHPSLIDDPADGWD